MPKPHPQGDLSTSRPPQAPSALTSAQSRAGRGARSCLQLAAPPDETARRRSRVEGLLAAGRLTIGCERAGLTHTVTVAGELDLATAAGLEVELMAVEATDATQIVLDLSGVTFMDSGAVHLIARADARCAAAAKRLRLLRGPPHSQRVFALAGADTLACARMAVSQAGAEHAGLARQHLGLATP